MGIRYPGRAQIDPMAPQALGICDRCGLQYNLRSLSWQYAWAGRELINKRILVCETCMDVPNEQLRTIRLPPDPYPIFDARPENFAVDEKNYLNLKQPPNGQPGMFPGMSVMVCDLEFSLGILASFSGISNVSADLMRGVLTAPTFDGVSVLTAELEQISNFIVNMSGVSDLEADITRGQFIDATLDGVSVLDADLLLFGPVREIDFFASNVASNSATINAPANIAAGDLIVALQRVRDTGLPTAAIPSGFTTINNVGLTDTRQILSYKIAVGNEGGVALSGMTTSFGAGGSGWAVLVFRGIYAADTANVVDVDGQITNAAPTNQTVTSSGGAAPLVVLGAFGSDSSIGTVSFTPSADGSISAMSTLGGPLQLDYKIYDSSPADVTVTKNDSGNRNVLQSCYVELSN